MTIWDVILIALYFPLCMFIGSRIRSLHKGDPHYQKWFMKGLVAKLLGGLAFALVYTFYYSYGGDTRSYFRDALLVGQSLGDGPLVFFEVLSRRIEGVSAEALDTIESEVHHR